MRKTLRSRRHRALITVVVATRLENKITQRDLAGRLGKSHSFISKFESGERRLDVIEFTELAEALKVDPEVLFARYLRW